MTKAINDDGKKEGVVYPLYSVGEALRIGDAVRELGGGNAPVSKRILAQHLNYAETGPSFFQRLSAAKAFGIVDGWGAYSLTAAGRLYFFPTSETAKQEAAVAILTTPRAFAALVQKFEGNRLPATQMLANIIHQECDISVSKKDTVASCFVRSAQYLGFIDSSGLLRTHVPKPQAPEHSPTIAHQDLNSHNIMQDTSTESPEEESGTHTYTLPLDKENKRKVRVSAPLDITEKEVKRVTRWLEVSLLIDAPSSEET